MARVFDGTNDYLYHATAAPVEYGPMSCALWFNKDALSANSWLMAEQSLTGGYYRGLHVTTTGNLRAYWKGADINYNESSNTFTATTWNHAGGWWNYKSVEAVYLNGVELASSKYNNGGTMLRNSFGAYVNGGTKLDGKLFWATKWNVQLTAEEFALLATGIHPFLIRPSNIVQHLPFGGLDVQNDTDWIEGDNFTANGSPTWSDDSPTGLIYPTMPQLTWSAAGAGPGPIVVPQLSASFSLFV